MKTQRAWRMVQRGSRETTAVRAMYWIMTALLVGTLLVLAVNAAYAEGAHSHLGPLPRIESGAGSEREEGSTATCLRACTHRQAWSPRSTQLAVLAAFAAIDYRQSSELFYNRGGYYEINPILGPHPTRTSMMIFGAAGVSLTWLAGAILPDRWATMALDSVIASEQYNIEENARVEAGQQRRISGIPIIISMRW